MNLEDLLQQVRACKVCEPDLPLGANPILRAGASARLMIVGQAPGIRVHRSGIPWNDPSGDRLRQWLEMPRELFYDQNRIAIVPTAFCYPGKGSHGDLPPRPECAPLWHPRLRAALPEIRLTLLVGGYAQAYYLGKRVKPTLAATVRAWREYLPDFFPVPHPSPRNLRWFKINPWFEAEVLPELRQRCRAILGPYSA